MISIRESNSRGQANFGWLDSRHTFSFGQYYDPQQMGVSALRVINDDKVAPSAGFSTHGHSNMEIISLVTQGEMIHKDSEGNLQHLPAGEFQLMSAGAGIMHSEYNASDKEPLHFLQIWVQPNEQGGPPGYQQKRFESSSPVTLVISPDGRDGTLTIKQDAFISDVKLLAGDSIKVPADTARHYYLHIIIGSVDIDGQTLNAGDGAKFEGLSSLNLKQQGEVTVKAILFDLP